MEIECPACSQEFEVGDDLVGKKVQCGGCQHHFVVEGISRDLPQKADKKRLYPRENRDELLDRFSRSTAVGVKTAGANTPNFQKASYASDFKAVDLGPVKPIYTFAMGIGILFFLICYSVFLIGGSPEGFINEMVQSKRFVLAGFGALVGFALMVFASVRKRALGVMVAVLLSLGLMVMPILFPYVDKKTLAVGDSKPAVEPESELSAAEQSIFSIKDRVGYDPVQKAIERSIRESDAENPEERVVAVYFQLLQEEFKLQIADYFKEEANLPVRPYFNARGLDSKNWLMIIEGGSLTINEVAKACERFGKVDRIHENLRLVEVVVQNLRLADADISELANEEGEDFYFANKNELNGIDLRRVKDAVVRLSAAQPKEYRVPIVKIFTKLMQTGNEEMREEVAKALIVWTVEEDDEAEEGVITAMNEMKDKRQKVPASMIDYLVTRGRLEVAPLLFKLWQDNPLEWEEKLVDFGSVIERDVIVHVRDANPALERSALRVIRRIGTSASLPRLEAMEESSDGEILQLLRVALDSIRKRG